MDVLQINWLYTNKYKTGYKQSRVIALVAWQKIGAN